MCESGPIFVLLIGDNLLAKKTFVNSFAYFLKFSRFEDAMGCPGEVKRHYEPSSLRYGESLRIKYRPSSKKVIKEYKVDGIAHDIRLIDLPTFGNVITDEDNIKKSMDFLATYKHIHAVCVFPRMWQFPSVQFKYMLSFMMVHFEKSIFNKINMIINKTSAILKEEVVSIITESIPDFSEKRIHILDDEAFNYLLAYYKGEIGYEACEKNAEAWKMSSIYARGLFRDLTKKHQTPAYEIRNTVFLNEIRCKIPELIKEMADLHNAIEYNKSVIKTEEITNGINLEKLKKKQEQYYEHYEKYVEIFSNIGIYIKVNTLAYNNDVFIEYLIYRQTRANQKVKHPEEVIKRFHENSRIMELILQSSARSTCVPTMDDISQILNSIKGFNKD